MNDGNAKNECAAVAPKMVILDLDYSKREVRTRQLLIEFDLFLPR